MWSRACEYQKERNSQTIVQQERDRGASLKDAQLLAGSRVSELILSHAGLGVGDVLEL